jgi:hypothetical protein
VRRQARHQDDPPCDRAATDEDQHARARRQLRLADEWDADKFEEIANKSDNKQVLAV